MYSKLISAIMSSWFKMQSSNSFSLMDKMFCCCFFSYLKTDVDVLNWAPVVGGHPYSSACHARVEKQLWENLRELFMGQRSTSLLFPFHWYVRTEWYYIEAWGFENCVFPMNKMKINKPGGQKFISAKCPFPILIPAPQTLT